MYRNIYFFILSLLAVACTEVTVLPSSDGGNPSHVPTVSVPLQLSASGMRIEQVQVGADGSALQSPTSTRASGGDVVQNEGEVQDVCVFQFGSDGKLAYKQYFQQLDVNTPSEKWVDILLRTDVGAGHYYVLANVGDVTADYAVGTTDEAAFTAHMLPTKLDNGRLVEGYLPMSGKTAKAVDPTKFNFSSGVPAHTNKIEVSLTRMVAKVELTLTTNALFTPSHASLQDVPAELEFASPATGSTTQEALSHYGPVSVTDGDGGAKVYTWYMPENLRGTSSSVTDLLHRTESNAPLGASYVLIGGLYEGTEVLYTLYLGSGTKTSPNDFNVRRNTYYKVSAHVRGAGLVDGRVQHIINLSEPGTANCYLTSKPYQWYKLKGTVRGNGAATDADISPTGQALEKDAPIAPQHAELVWQTVGHRQVIQRVEWPGNGNEYVYFKTGPAKEGNAVVCVKDGTAEDSKILWSWHIWHSELTWETIQTQEYLTDPKTVAGVYKPNPRTLHVMDRNLGAYAAGPFKADEHPERAFGLFYQWGRKDPFVGSDFAPTSGGTATGWYGNQMQTIYDKDGKAVDASLQMAAPWMEVVSASRTQVWHNVAYVVEHPHTFITGGWIYGFQTSIDVANSGLKLWGSPRIPADALPLQSRFIGKTIYDPCPKGYVVVPPDWVTNWTMINGYHKLSPVYSNTVTEEKKALTPYMPGTYYGRRFYLKGTSGDMVWLPMAGSRWTGGNTWKLGFASFHWNNSHWGNSATRISYTGLQTDTFWFLQSEDPTPSCAQSVRCVREEDALANKHLNP